MFRQPPESRFVVPLRDRSRKSIDDAPNLLGRLHRRSLLEHPGERNLGRAGPRPRLIRGLSEQISRSHRVYRRRSTDSQPRITLGWRISARPNPYPGQRVGGSRNRPNPDTTRVPQPFVGPSEAICSRTRCAHGRQRFLSQTARACPSASRASSIRPACSSTVARCLATPALEPSVVRLFPWADRPLAGYWVSGCISGLGAVCGGCG